MMHEQIAASDDLEEIEIIFGEPRGRKGTQGFIWLGKIELAIAKRSSMSIGPSHA